MLSIAAITTMAAQPPLNVLHPQIQEIHGLHYGVHSRAAKWYDLQSERFGTQIAQLWDKRLQRQHLARGEQS